MKHIALIAGMAGLFALPASAGSIEVIDGMITGAAGPTSSIIILGPTELCAPQCGDGVEAITTSSADLSPARTINFNFARKFPDPAVPVPAPAADGGSGDSANPFGGGASASPAPAAPAAASAPSAPADAGVIPPQPPVAESNLRPSGTGEMLQEPGVPKGADEATARAAANKASQGHSMQIGG